MFNEETTAALSAPLARSRVKSRKQGSAQVSYLEAWDIMDALNSIFGFGNWSSEERDIKCVHEAMNDKKGWDVSYIATVRLSVQADDGTQCCFYDGTGSGHGRNQRYLGDSHESAIKEATTDALKRASIHLGNQFGLALYDKTQSNVDNGQNSAKNGDSHERVNSDEPLTTAKTKRLTAMAERIKSLGRDEVIEEHWCDVVTNGEADRLMATLTAAMNLETQPEQPKGTVN
jgi:DNA repair and recombination protein RAD52